MYRRNHRLSKALIQSGDIINWDDYHEKREYIILGEMLEGKTQDTHHSGYWFLFAVVLRTVSRVPKLRLAVPRI